MHILCPCYCPLCGLICLSYGTCLWFCRLVIVYYVALLLSIWWFCYGPAMAHSVVLLWFSFCGHAMAHSGVCYGPAMAHFVVMVYFVVLLCPILWSDVVQRGHILWSGHCPYCGTAMFLFYHVSLCFAAMVHLWHILCFCHCPLYGSARAQLWPILRSCYGPCCGLRWSRNDTLMMLSYCPCCGRAMAHYVACYVQLCHIMLFPLLPMMWFCFGPFCGLLCFSYGASCGSALDNYVVMMWHTLWSDMV